MTLKKLSKPPYVSPMNGFYTSQLFVEEWGQLNIKDRTIEPIFSLKDDKPGLINARKTFVALMDPTGIAWADMYLDSYEHWVRLTKTKWFALHLDSWLEEIKIRTVASSLSKIKEIAEGESAQSMAANKYLAEEGWKRPQGARGRPSKAEMDAELQKNVKALEASTEDLERIGGLTVINGGRKV